MENTEENTFRSARWWTVNVILAISISAAILAGAWFLASYFDARQAESMRPAIDQLRIEHPTATEGCLKSFYSYEVKGHRFPTEHHRECLRTEQLEQLNSRLDAIEAALTGIGTQGAQ